MAYRGQSNVEFAFKDMKNPYHMAFRPQFHWTDQKIEIHFLICMIGYLLTATAYSQAKKLAGYQRNISNFLEDLRSIRLTSIIENKLDKNTSTEETPNIKYRLETIPTELRQVAEVLGIHNDALRSNIRVGVYAS